MNTYNVDFYTLLTRLLSHESRNKERIGLLGQDTGLNFDAFL